MRRVLRDLLTVAAALLLVAPPASAGHLPFPGTDVRLLRGMYVTTFSDAAGRAIDPAPGDGLSAPLSTLRLTDLATGSPNRLVLRFRNWGEVFPSVDERLLLRRDRWPVITLMPKSISLADVADGLGDAYLAAQAAALEAAIVDAEAATGRAQHAFIRFAHEMNGNWYPWGVAGSTATPGIYARAQADYRAAFRHVHDVVAATAPDVEMVWAPNWRSAPLRAYNEPILWYPGDAYVDWIGVTGYNRYPAGWREPSSLFVGIRALAAASVASIGGDPLARHVGGSKPIMIAETSSIDVATDGSGRTKATWLAHLAAYLRAAHEIRAVIWFNRAKRCADGTTGIATCPLVDWQPAEGLAARTLPWEWDSSVDDVAPFKALWGDKALMRAGPAGL